MVCASARLVNNITDISLLVWFRKAPEALSSCKLPTMSRALVAQVLLHVCPASGLTIPVVLTVARMSALPGLSVASGDS